MGSTPVPLGRLIERSACGTRKHKLHFKRNGTVYVRVEETGVGMRNAQRSAEKSSERPEKKVTSPTSEACLTYVLKRTITCQPVLLGENSREELCTKETTCVIKTEIGQYSRILHRARLQWRHPMLPTTSLCPLYTTENRPMRIWLTPKRSSKDQRLGSVYLGNSGQNRGSTRRTNRSTTIRYASC